MGTVKPGTGESRLKEEIIIDPSDTFSTKALVGDNSLYEKAAADRLGFWAEQAESLDWYRKWDLVLDWNNPPFAKWFVNGKINVSVNCIDRHLKTWRKTKAALVWEGEPGDNTILTYQDLYREVTKCANVLKKLGVRRGDRVSIYMGMIPELPIVMLACARIGALHNVIFSGYSPDSVANRINDCQPKLVVTADGGWRRGEIVPLKKYCDEALAKCPSVEKTLLVKRVGNDPVLEEGKDYWYHELMAEADIGCEPAIMDAGDPLYILYTSGAAGRPKGVVHTTGGYLTGVASTHKYVFDIKDDDVFWCTSDIGWTTGHSYVVYGPLANGCTTVMYEGSQDWPEKDRFWDIIEKYQVNIFYTAPTAIRASMHWGTEWLQKKDLSSLRLIGTAGEPITPDAWMWYYKHVGGERCPVVDTWWQTETGMILIAPLPGVTPLKPGSITKPFPGVEVAIVDVDGDPVPYGSGGFLVVKSPWPSMLRSIWKNNKRYKEQYWSMYEGIYLTGDSAQQDKDGYYWIVGRVDDIVNVGGHRLDTMEIEHVLVNHPVVAEVAVIGEAHELRGQAISAFVTLKENVEASPDIIENLKEHVVKKIGALARPENIYIMAELPKTRSGKVVRRLLRDIAEGHTP